MMLSAFRTAVSGMQSATRRVEAVASNVAMATATGPLPDASGATATPRPVTAVTTSTAGGVVTTLVPRSPAFQTVADPGSPFADADGRVAAPAVDLTSEMTDLLAARIQYRASARVAEVSDRIAREALDRLA